MEGTWFRGYVVVLGISSPLHIVIFYPLFTFTKSSLVKSWSQFVPVSTAVSVLALCTKIVCLEKLIAEAQEKAA